MAFKKYTKCYHHTPGDKPFHESDLIGFVAGTGALWIAAAAIGFIGGAFVFGFIMWAIGYAAAIVAVANEWLSHRLVCLSHEPKCAIGKIKSEPDISGLGEFDNDEFFDLRLMPHRPEDEYKDGQPGVSEDPRTQAHPANDIPKDGFQGQWFVSRIISDLPFKADRTKLHAEAEGDFWVRMRDWALALGVIVAGAAALGAAGGAALGCLIGALFGGVGCLVGAIIGFILGLLAGTAAGHLLVSALAFNANPGDIEDANVGDEPLGALRNGDPVIIYGEHVYDGFHEGWHEFHPLMAVMRVNDSDAGRYLQWNPDFPAGETPPLGLTVADMRVGLESAAFRARAEELRERWCYLVGNAFADATRSTQARPENRWAIHPDVDGCMADEGPIIH